MVARTMETILTDFFADESQFITSTFEAMACFGLHGEVYYEDELFRTKFRWTKRRLVDALTGQFAQLPGLVQWVEQCRKGPCDAYYAGLFTLDNDSSPIQVIGTAVRGGHSSGLSMTFVVKEIGSNASPDIQQKTTGRPVRLDNVSVALADHVRNSLTSVRGFTQFLRSKPVQEQDHYLDVMLYDIDRVLGTIDDLMLITQNAPEHPEKTDVIEVLTSVLSKPYAPSSRAKVVWTGSRKPTFASCYRETLERAITHIVTNALESSTPESLVLLEAGNLDADYVYFKCRDHGSGMTLRQLSRIGRLLDSQNIDALGLSFFIISQIVREEDGTLELISGPDRGVAVYITVPAWDQGCDE